MRVKIKAFMQQREREVKEGDDANLPDHKQAEVERFQVFSDVTRQPIFCAPCFGPAQKPGKQVPLSQTIQMVW
jgi:hypothetical protein